jgi:hypothetical protein
MKMGIRAYNEECRSIVMKYSTEWEQTVKRIGRWIDFKNDYKTLNTSFMESVWWVFKELYGKGQIYRGFSVSSGPPFFVFTMLLQSIKLYQNMNTIDHAILYRMHNSHVKL